MGRKMAIRLAVPALLLLALGASARSYAQDRDDYRYERGRRYERVGSLVDRVQYDLGRANTYFSRSDQRRVAAARHELAEFQRAWAAGRFDRRDLNDAIGAVQTVVNRNALGYRDRNILLEDLNRLREVREMGYRGAER